MRDTDQFLLVDSRVLPDTFLKVVQAKKLLATGQVKSLSAAAKAVGMSRSALYKYKDRVYAYKEDGELGVATVYAELTDQPGMLSAFLTALSESGANVLTINQNIPVDDVAPVSVSMRTGAMNVGLTVLADRLRALPGVMNVRLLAN